MQQIAPSWWIGRGLPKVIFDVITLFPQMFDALTQYGITRAPRSKASTS